MGLIYVRSSHKTPWTQLLLCTVLLGGQASPSLYLPYIFRTRLLTVVEYSHESISLLQENDWQICVTTLLSAVDLSAFEHSQSYVHLAISCTMGLGLCYCTASFCRIFG